MGACEEGSGGDTIRVGFEVVVLGSGNCNGTIFSKNIGDWKKGIYAAKMNR